MSETVRLGITGVGSLGRHLGETVGDLDDARIEAIADISDENRADAGEHLSIPESNRHADQEAMLDGTALDGVIIATPHTLHYDQVVAALERGIDTLCEKPLCTDLEDARDLVTRSDEGDAVLMVGYQRHLSPTFRTVREELDERVGEVNYLTAEITQDWIEHQQNAWRSNPDLSGGGQLYDTGSHLLDVVLWTTGLDPVAVDAEMQFWDDDRRVDIQAALTIKFANDAVASVAVSGDAPRNREHVRAWGEEGGFAIERAEWGAESVEFIDAGGDVFKPRLDAMDHGAKTRAFVDLIRNGDTPPATARDALAVTAVTEAAYESARTGGRVTLDLTL